MPKLGHNISAVKGWVDLHALDYSAPLASSVTFNVPDGRVVSLNANGEFVTGHSGAKMPMFLIRAADSPDVKETLPTEGVEFFAVTPSGRLTALVATGAYELETTEFDTSQTYAPNDLLRGIENDTDPATGGLLTNQNSAGTGPVTAGGADAICGVVSSGVVNGRLRFWPVYIPK